MLMTALADCLKSKSLFSLAALLALALVSKCDGALVNEKRFHEDFNGAAFIMTSLLRIIYVKAHRHTCSTALTHKHRHIHI